MAVTDDPFPSFPDIVKYVIHKERASDYSDAAKFIERNKYDALIIQHEFGLFGGYKGVYLYDLLLALKDVPIAKQFIAHTVEPDMPAEQTFLYRMLVSLVDEVVALSEVMCPLLRLQGINPNCRTIFHGVPALLPNPTKSNNQSIVSIKSRKQTFKQQQGLDPSHFHVMIAGLIRPGKGIELVLSVLPLIVPTHPNIRLVLVGDTGTTLAPDGRFYNETLAELTRSLDIESRFIIRITQFQSDEMLERWLLASDVYLAPYKYLGQASSGMVPLAMAAGCVVVASPFLHASALLSSGAGIIISQSEPSHLAIALLSLLENPQKQESMAKQAVAVALTFSWQEVGKQHLNAVYNLMSTKRPTPLSAGNSNKRGSFGMSFRDLGSIGIRTESLMVTMSNNFAGHITIQALRNQQILSQNIYILSGCFVDFSLVWEKNNENTRRFINNNFLIDFEMRGSKKSSAISSWLGYSSSSSKLQRLSFLRFGHRLGTRVTKIELEESSNTITINEIIPLKDLNSEFSLLASAVKKSSFDNEKNLVNHPGLSNQARSMVLNVTTVMRVVSSRLFLKVSVIVASTSAAGASMSVLKSLFHAEDVEVTVGVEYLSSAISSVKHKRNGLVLGVIHASSFAMGQTKPREDQLSVGPVSLPAAHNKKEKKKSSQVILIPNSDECFDYLKVTATDTSISKDVLRWQPFKESSTSSCSPDSIKKSNHVDNSNNLGGTVKLGIIRNDISDVHYIFFRKNRPKLNIGEKQVVRHVMTFNFLD